MKYIISTYFLVLLIDTVFAQAPVLPSVQDELYATEKVQIGGYLGDRLNASYNNRILAQDVNRLIEPFKHRTEDHCWQTEFWGKWFTSAILAYRYRPEPQLKSVLDKAVSDLLSTQSADGYIGNYSLDKRLQQWDIWGRKYCLLGLLAYYDITHDTKSLQASCKIIDHLMHELAEHHAMISKQGNHRGMAATSILEPVCLLYTRTGETKYLDFAKEIVRQWETSDGPQLLSKASVNVADRFPKPKSWWSWEQGQKAYEMMSCYEGLLELYRITGKQEYKKAVEQTWNNINETEMNIAGSGSSVECWFGGKELQTAPIKKYQETCVTATWIKLSQQLLRLTGEVKYADAIELTYYNALLGAMKTDGSDWAKYSPLIGQRRQGEEQCGMGINCCVASGPRGLFTLPLSMVMRSKEGININFYSEGIYYSKTPNNQPLQIIQQTDYPVSGKIILKVVLPKIEDFTLRIRIPSWSGATELIVNNEKVKNLTPGTFTAIKRIWKNGDEVVLKLEMRGRVIKMGEHPQYMAIIRGPLVLARDIRLGGPDMDETIKPVFNDDGNCDIELAGINQKGIWLQFKVPFTIESYTPEGKPVPVTPLILCDYSSAGNTINEQSRFRVWLPQMVSPVEKE